MGVDKLTVQLLSVSTGPVIPFIKVYSNFYEHQHAIDQS
jgi:hypothetical protein